MVLNRLFCIWSLWYKLEVDFFIITLNFNFRYLSGYMQGREKASPQAHQLMGEIMESLGDKESAVESYKK